MTELDPTARRVVAELDALGATYELMPCDPELADTAAFCEHYGVAPEDSANTILVRGKVEPPRWVAGLVLATTRLDVNRTVRKRLGVKKASFASADDTMAMTGMAVGGVTVFGLPAELAVWVDARVMERPLVIIGGGSRSWKVRLAPTELLRRPGVEVVEDLAMTV